MGDAATDTAPPVRQYLYIDQLAAVTPWSVLAIRTMISRGVFQCGVHYFKPLERTGRPIFSWAAVVDFIEARERTDEHTTDTIPLANGVVVDLNDATATAHRLHGRSA